MILTFIYVKALIIYKVSTSKEKVTKHTQN
jgi:hypothetical protein